MLPPRSLSSWRSHKAQLPYGPLVYSQNRRYKVADDDFNYGSGTSQEMETIAQAIYRFHAAYDSAVETFGSDHRVLRTPSGPRSASRGTLYDLFVALRALRLFAEDDGWSGLNLEHLFSAEHWYELLRVVSMVYDQEYRYDSSNSATGFLSEERFFGSGCQARDCSLSVIYQMYQICVRFCTPEDYGRFSSYEKEDSDPDRLQKLTSAYRQRAADYYDDDSDSDDDDPDAQLCHVLPLTNAGFSRGGGGRRTARRKGWQTFSVQPYDGRACSRYVYFRGSCYVEVSVDGGWVSMETTAVPRSFIRDYDVDMEYDDDDEEGASYYRLDKLIDDWNGGNYYAGNFLLSQIFDGNISIPGNTAAWCPTGESGYEGAARYLNLGALLDVLGDLLITSDDDIILPVSYDGMLCYLTKARGRRSEDFYVTWRDVDYTQVTAQAYTDYRRDARLLEGSD